MNKKLFILFLLVAYVYSDISQKDAENHAKCIQLNEDKCEDNKNCCLAEMDYDKYEKDAGETAAKIAKAADIKFCMGKKAWKETKKAAGDTYKYYDCSSSKILTFGICILLFTLIL